MSVLSVSLHCGELCVGRNYFFFFHTKDGLLQMSAKSERLTYFRYRRPDFLQLLIQPSYLHTTTLKNQAKALKQQKQS
jgi:hypothetical protein